MLGGDQLCVACSRLTGYPFEGQYAVAIDAPSPAGFTRAALFRQLVRIYAAMYAGSEARPRPALYNTLVGHRASAWHGTASTTSWSSAC